MNLQVLEKLLEASRQLAETREFDPLLVYAMQLALELFNAEQGYLVLVGQDRTLDFRIRQDCHGNQLDEPEGQISHTILNRVVSQNEPIITVDALQEPSFADASSVQLLGLRSVMCVPLIARGRTLGAIYLENRREKGVFERSNLKPLGYFAAQVAVAMENATLNDQLEARVAQRTLELEARNEELNAFAQTVAHDLRNPLGLVVGYAEVLHQELINMSEDDVRKYLVLIAQHGRKMSDIIEALLTLAGVRQAKVTIDVLDMGPIVESAQRRLANLIETHHVELVIPSQWPSALGHGPWIEEVWVNYLSNAIKYGGRPARVELGAELDTQQQMVRFWVRDNGNGLTKAEQSCLFRPFTRLQRDGTPGHGLGLSIVQRIMDKLEGQVRVESSGKAGEGCTFSFVLPAANPVGPADQTLYHRRKARRHS